MGQEEAITEMIGVSWLGMGVLLSPLLLTFLLFLVLFYPKKLSFSECLFTSIPTSQSFAAVCVFFTAGFSYGFFSFSCCSILSLSKNNPLAVGYVDVWLLRGFVGGCSIISVYLLLQAGALEKLGWAFRSIEEEKAKKAKSIVIGILTLLVILALYHLYLHHTLSPYYHTNSGSSTSSSRLTIFLLL